MNNCSICKSDEKLIHHHLSYEPEIIVIICRRCEVIMHRLADLQRMPQNQQDVINNWVSQYGSLWKNAREKYEKSEYNKNVKKEWQKTDKFKNIQRKYRESDKRKNQLKEYYFKHLPPKKQIKILEKMEKHFKQRSKENEKVQSVS